MDITEFINLITNVGFPVVVSAYLLVRLGNQLQSLTASIDNLNNIVSARLGIAIKKDHSKDEDNAA